jgi:hypothetical protein
MPIGKEDILQVLNDPILHKISFSVGVIQINSDEYDEVADYIEARGVTIKPGNDKVANYYAEIDTLETKAGEPPMDLNARTNVLHECTHIAADINEYAIRRATDEAAAYLAQITYLLLLDPNTPKPPMGRAATPVDNLMRVGMDLVEKYKLGDPAGYNRSISPGDIDDMENAVLRDPHYGNKFNKTTRLIANGIKLSNQQWANLLARFAARTNDKLIAQDVNDMLTTRVQSSAHENWVTDDNELITLLDSYRRGADPQKRTVRQKLIHIFLTITQASATQLFGRFTFPRKGDLVSDRFNTVFSRAIKLDMLSALQIPR